MKSILGKLSLLGSIRGLLLAVVWLGFQSASAQTPMTNFDHVTTGYPLTGVHVSQRCESCHVNGTFKGTPRDCASCHVSGARLATLNVVKTPQHFPTSQTCDTCHNTATFAGTKFNHLGVSPNACTVCHNGMMAPGKPSGHLLTVLPCGQCHRPTGWIPAIGIDHSQFTAATDCTSCHNGVRATGKSPMTHIQTAQNCISCHNTRSFNPWTWTHATNQTPVTGQCETCHTGQYAYALGAGVGHIPYKTLTGVAITNCDTCHKAGYLTFVPGQFHVNVSINSQCETCHLSTAYGLTGKPATAIHTGVFNNCQTCHTSTSTWSSGKPDHTTYTTATICANCHNNTTALGMPTVGHITLAGTYTNCITCHSATATSFNPGFFHSKVSSFTAVCSSCHDGTKINALGVIPSHIPYKSVPLAASAECNVCHTATANYTTFVPGRFHANVTLPIPNGGCPTCHLTTAYNVTGKPTDATHTAPGAAGDCSSSGCHTSTSAWTSSAKPDHSLYTPATVCTGCHGSTALGMPAVTHIPLGGTYTNCITCHSATAASFYPGYFHSKVSSFTATCASCHTGQYTNALGLSSNHVPYKSVTGASTLDCNGCHKATANYTTFNPGLFHSNVTVSTQCSTCHLTTAYGVTGMPATATHQGVTGNCESCHKSTASWLTATFTHSAANAVGTGTCDTCHGGLPPANGVKGRTVGVHIPYTAGVARCDSCHLGQVSFTASFSMNHSVVTSTPCKNCHNGSFTSQGTQGALGVVSNHIPYTGAGILNGSTLDCSACHSSTTSFLTEKMNHNGSMGAGSGQCTTCHATGTSYLGTMQKKSLTHQSSGKPDCSTSGCHKPLGSKGSSYVKWN